MKKGRGKVAKPYQMCGNTLCLNPKHLRLQKKSFSKYTTNQQKQIVEIPFVSEPDFINEGCPNLKVTTYKGDFKHHDTVLYKCLDKNCINKALRYSRDNDRVLRACCMLFVNETNKEAA